MKRIRTIMATVLALGAAVAAAGPASADPAGTNAWWDCPVGYFCAWYNADGVDIGGNEKPEFYGKAGAPDLRKFDLNDHVYSVYNRTGQTWCAYPDNNSTDVNGPGKFPDPWPIGNWQGNTSRYNMQGVISSLEAGPCHR